MMVLPAVQQLLCERLALDPQEVTPEARVFQDLGSDSLDLLDILFSLEKHFDIKLRNSELDRLLRGEFHQPDHLSEADLEGLSEWLPSLAGAQRPVSPADLFAHITVSSLAHIVEKKLQEARHEQHRA